MPRKNLTAERTEQILDAFERCIAQFGLDGSSLEKISEEAGMKRTILRHYIGNRDDIIRALCLRMVKEWDRQLRELEQAPAGNNPKKALLDLLFYSSEHTSDSILVIESLIASADRYPEVGQFMRQFVDDYTQVISKRLKLIHAKAPAAKRWQVAYGILSILFNDASLLALKMPEKYEQAARASTARLIDSLASS